MEFLQILTFHNHMYNICFISCWTHTFEEIGNCDKIYCRSIIPKQGICYKLCFYYFIEIFLVTIPDILKNYHPK